MNANAAAAAINVDNEEIRAYPHAKHGDIRVVKKSGENKVKDDNIEYALNYLQARGVYGSASLWVLFKMLCQTKMLLR